MGEMTWWLRRPLLWVAFAAVSLWLGWQGWIGESAPYGDVSYVYRYWAGAAAGGGPIVGISTQWVYPILALAPILAVNVFGGDTYAFAWIVLATLANAAGFAFLLGRHNTAPARRIAAWWWLAFLMALGPIAVARLDSLVTPLAIAGLLLVFARPTMAAVLLTIGTWIKVWPVALVASAFIAGRNRWRIVVAAGITSVSIILITAVLGAGLNVFSFLGQQSSRGLQIESPWSTPFLWMASAHVPGYSVFYNRDLLTFEVSGAGDTISAGIASLLLVLVATALLAYAWLATRRGADPLKLLPALSLALVAALILLNKVGSPQYIGWLAAPVVAGLVFDSARFRLPAIVVILTALVTQLFYPFAYQNVLVLQPAALAVLTLRNLLEVASFVVALRILITSKVKS
jgi:hypothetical protein